MGQRRSAWTREQITAEICRRHEEGGDLSLHAMRRYHQPLVSAAVRHFGGWRQAVEAAGLDYEPIRRLGIARHAAGITKWTSESTVRTIRRLWKLGEDIRPTILQRRYPGLPSAARRIYGSWDSFVEAAGIPRYAARHPGRRHAGWKRLWLTRLTRQASGREEAGDVEARDYRFSFRARGTVDGGAWLRRLQREA